VIWAGARIVHISVVGLLAIGHELHTLASIGMGLIIARVAVINVLSRNVGYQPAGQARFAGA
jgi:multidrug transporter EmrE-like cation transporter